MGLENLLRFFYLPDNLLLIRFIYQAKEVGVLRSITHKVIFSFLVKQQQQQQQKNE